jgi:D-alanyl-lipoteichoic acid acyltransferase DltB (MBOAT superfamily)
MDLALMTTFLASGIWHGASWTFVAWGFLHGLGMIVNYHWDEYYKTLCRRDRSYVKKRQSRSYRFVAWLLTMVFFILTLVPFRAPDGATALEFARSMFAGGGGQAVEFGSSQIMAVAFIVGYHLLELKPFERLRKGFFNLPAPVRGVSYGLAVVFLMLMTPIGSGTFIYQQF